jgi:hypothetical protein
VSEPAEEIRRVSGPALHQVGHSVGIVLDDAHQVSDGAYSFAVEHGQALQAPVALDPADDDKPWEPEPDDGSGPVELVELAGWRWAGQVPAVENPPASLLAVLTVSVESTEPEHLAVVRELIDQHQERFGECRVWAANGASDALKRWAAAGCPDDLVVPTEEELAAANTLHPDVEDRLERRGPGWDTSEPVADDVGSEIVPPEVAQQAEEMDAAAQQTYVERQALERSQPMPEEGRDQATSPPRAHRRAGTPPVSAGRTCGR